MLNDPNFLTLKQIKTFSFTQKNIQSIDFLPAYQSFSLYLEMAN